MWKTEISGDLGQGWSTPKNWEEGEAEEENIVDTKLSLIDRYSPAIP